MTVNFSNPTLPSHLPKLFRNECQLSAQPIRGYGLRNRKKKKKEEKKEEKEQEKNPQLDTQNILKPPLEMKLGFVLLCLAWMKVRQGTQGKSMFLFSKARILRECETSPPASELPRNLCNAIIPSPDTNVLIQNVG